MFIKSFTAALIVLVGTINVSQAGTIKDDEERDLHAKCTIISETRMECQEYCTVYNRNTGAQISQGTEGEFWNCDNTNKMLSFQAGYNDKPENQDKSASDCKARPGQDHEGDCIIDSQELVKNLMCPRMGATFISTEHPGCFGANNYEGCPNWGAALHLQGNEYWFEYTNSASAGSSSSFTTSRFKWVTSPTGADVSGEYTVTPNPDFSHSGAVRFTAFGRFDYPIGFTACEKNNPSNCTSMACKYTMFLEP